MRQAYHGTSGRGEAASSPSNFKLRHYPLAVRPSLARPYSGAVVSEKLFNANSLQKSRTVLLVIPLLDERRCQGARRKAAAFASHEQNRREASKGRGSRDTRGMKGWRPSACPLGSKPVRALCGRILAGHRIDRPVFFREVPVLGPAFLFRAHRVAAAESDKRRPSVRDHEKAPALHLA